MKMKTFKVTKFDIFLKNLFGTIGIFGWFIVIWSPVYKIQLGFTVLLSLLLGILFNHIITTNGLKK